MEQLSPSTGNGDDMQTAATSNGPVQDSLPSEHEEDVEGDDMESVGSNWSHDDKKRAAHSDDVQVHLRQWMQAHLQFPYPSRSEKERLAKETGLQFIQVAYWFTNARRRLLPAMIKEENRKRSEIGLPPIKRQTDQWARPLTEKPPHLALFKDHMPPETLLDGASRMNGSTADSVPLRSPVRVTGGVNSHILWQPDSENLRKGLYLPLASPVKRSHVDIGGEPLPRKKVKEEGNTAGQGRTGNGEIDPRQPDSTRRSSCSSGSTSVQTRESERHQRGSSSKQSERSSNGSAASIPAAYYSQQNGTAQQIVPSVICTAAMASPPQMSGILPGTEASVTPDLQYVQYAVPAHPSTLVPSVMPGQTVLVHNQAMAQQASFAAVNGHPMVQSPTQLRPSHSHGAVLAGPSMQPFGNVLMPSMPGHTLPPQHAQGFINRPVYLTVARGQ